MQFPKSHWPLSFSDPKSQRFKSQRLQDANATKSQTLAFYKSQRFSATNKRFPHCVNFLGRGHDVGNKPRPLNSHMNESSSRIGWEVPMKLVKHRSKIQEIVYLAILDLFVGHLPIVIYF